MRLPRVVFINSPTFFKKTIDKLPQKCGVLRPLINKVIRSGAADADFLIGGNLLKTFNPSGYAAYQERVLTQLRKYFPGAVLFLLLDCLPTCSVPSFFPLSSNSFPILSIISNYQ